MIRAATARALRDAGIRWRPTPGDAFVVDASRLPGQRIDTSELDGEVFHLADMTVEVHDLPTGPVIGFNGTVEWALDSVDAQTALWLPHEHQLRGLLGNAFRGLTQDGPEFRVTVALFGCEQAFTADAADEAYAAALLYLLTADSPARSSVK